MYQNDMVIGLGIIQQILAKLAVRTRRKSGGGRRREQKLGKTYSVFPVTQREHLYFRFFESK